MNDDLISRSALRKAVNDFYDNSFKGIVSSDLIKYAEAVDELIDNAPTVEPCTDCCESMKQAISEFNANYRKKGKWIKNPLQGLKDCSVCHYVSIEPKNYCPNCGADMRGDV